MRTLLSLVAMLSATAHAATVEYTDSGAFFADVGAVTTADFTGFVLNEQIVDQYAGIGITIPTGPTAYGPATVLYPQDGWGVISASGFEAQLDTPATAMAIDFAGTVRIELYDDAGALVHSSSTVASGGGASPVPGAFLGLVSTVPFSSIRVYDTVDNVPNIDDLHVAFSSGPSLDIVGACPGPAVISMAGLTPSSNVAVVRSSGAGVTAVPAGPCAGTLLDLASPLALIGFFPTDATGGLSASPTLAAPMCGQLVQVLDMATCAVTNVIGL